MLTSASSAGRSLVRRSLSLVCLFALLAFFCCRDDEIRVQLQQRVRTADDFARQWRDLLWPPWRPLLVYVSLDDDVHLYYEYTRLVLGEDADLAYIAARHQTDSATELAMLRAQVARHPTGLRLPYRDVSIEYPPVALAFMLAPRLFVRGYPAYSVAYAVLATLLYLLSWWLGWRLVRGCRFGLSGDELLRRAVVVTAALGPLLVARLDVLPAVLVIAAIAALTGGWPILAGPLLLLGAGAKLFPLLLIPSLSALLLGLQAPGRRMLVRLYTGVGLGLLCGGAFYLMVGHQLSLLFGSIGLYRARPVQIESIIGAVALALGAPVEVSFGSVNSHFAGSERLVQVWGLGTVVLLLGHAVLAWRWGRRRSASGSEDLATAVSAWVGSALCVIWLTSKVLSPQYLIWGVPLLAILPRTAGRRIFYCQVAALALTQLYFPLLYVLLQERWAPAVLLLLARNVALLWLALRALPRSGGLTVP